ncbi:MAG: SpoIIE family protein phosphatase [Deltaproteobacteria bacterium]|nr:SpoIIE family protein phosphatase [Deltaproteobacteria bacterium]
MDQQQFKIGMSVSTKLLITISLLLATPIFFINISAISLFRNDKKIYIYDSQATTAVLTGREFVSYLDSGLSTLKLVVGTADLSGPLAQQTKNTIDFYLNNQHALIGVELFGLDTATNTFNRVHQQFLPNALAAMVTTPEKIAIEPASVLAAIPELTKRGYYFRNISKEGQPAMLSITFADLTHPPAKGPAPIAVGYVSLQHFSADSSSLNRFTVADRSGAILFHSNERMLFSDQSVAQDSIFQEALISSVSAGAKEYLTPKGVRTLGSFYKPGLELVALSQIDYDEAMRATYTLTEKFIVLGLASLGIMIMLGLFFSRRVTAPLNRLFMATAQVSSGNFKINLPISSRDEIGALTASFVAMSHKISDLVQGTADKVRVDQELEIVKTVQQNLFPPGKIQNDQLLLVNHYQSAAECGGDWLGYFRTVHRHTLIVADATGHGLPSALMTASARGCFSVLEKLVTDNRFELNPSDMLAVANRVVFDSGQGKIMMTAAVFVFDFSTHIVSFSSAAQNPPWLFRSATDGLKQMSLIATGPRLGEAPEIATPYEIKQMPFQKNDTIFFYTDGLLEGKNKGGVQYGKKQARKVIEEAISLEPEPLINSIMADFMTHNAGKKLDDDVTLGVLRVLA